MPILTSSWKSEAWAPEILEEFEDEADAREEEADAVENDMHESGVGIAASEGIADTEGTGDVAASSGGSACSTIATAPGPLDVPRRRYRIVRMTRAVILRPPGPPTELIPPLKISFSSF